MILSLNQWHEIFILLKVMSGFGVSRSITSYKLHQIPNQKLNQNSAMKLQLLRGNTAAERETLSLMHVQITVSSCTARCGQITYNYCTCMPVVLDWNSVKCPTG